MKVQSRGMPDDRYRTRHSVPFELKDYKKLAPSEAIQKAIPNTAIPISQVSTNDLSRLLEEVNSFIQDSKQQCEQLEMETDQLNEWMKKNAAFNAESQSEVAKAAEDIKLSKDSKVAKQILEKEKATGTLRIKKTDDGTFVVTLPKELKKEESEDGGVSSKGNFQRRGTGNKNLSRMQQLNEQAVSEKPKAPNQTPISTFWSYIDGFFKPIAEEDFNFLEDCVERNPQAFIVPPLGKSYATQYERVPDVISEDSRPSLFDRLVSCLVEENLMPLSVDDDFAEDTNSLPAESDYHDLIDFEDRLKYELQRNGVLAEDNVCDISKFRLVRDFKEDDEISIEIRALQAQLKHQTEVNQERKRLLAEFVKTRMAAQEFYSILDELDKQIDSIFSRKWKTVKRRKKGQPVVACPVLSELQPLVEKRMTLIQYFKDVIPTRLSLQSSIQPLFPEVKLNAKSFYRNGIPTLPPKFPVLRKTGIFSIDK